MATVYQIMVKGTDANFPDSLFKCSSKKIYTHRPSQTDIDEFIQKCAENIHPLVSRLNVDAEYSINILELELINNI